MAALNSLKKKKVLAFMLAIFMAMSVFNLALSAEEPEPTDKITTSETEVIPVYGYIGPLSPIIPTDPETEIYVEVPIKIMFAAFDTQEGAVSSPVFKITNLSEKTDIKVEIADFSQQIEPAINLNDSLSLKLVTPAKTDLVSELFPADYSTAKVMTDKLVKNTEDAGDNVLSFTIDGTWSGSFNEEIQPVFDMTLKFSAAE